MQYELFLVKPDELSRGVTAPHVVLSEASVAKLVESVGSTLSAALAQRDEL